MKVLDHRGRPVLNSHQAVHKEMAEEGLLEFDLDEFSLLGEGEGDDDWDPYDDGIDDNWYSNWDETCKRCGSVVCKCAPLIIPATEYLSCYDDGEFGW